MFNRFLALALGCWLGSEALAAQPPLNVVVILTDDQGWGDLSLNGNQNLNTPQIDSLARDGVRFDRFYVCPVCSPTRAEFLTGRYHPRSGVFSTSAGGERMDLDEQTIADVFRAAGYITGAFGKWHNGMQYPYHPNGRGFDEFYGFCSGHWGDYFSPPLEQNGAPVEGRGFIADDLTEQAMAFVEHNRDRPFFCYLPYNTPHSPMQVPNRFYDKFADGELAMRHREPEREDVAHTRAALAMCESIDWNVGRLLEKLKELGLEDRTLVVFFCDNGPNGYRWNGDMRGRKGWTDEGGVRSPLLMRLPGTLPAGVSIPQIAGAIDLLPTLTELAGVPVVGGQALDGRSLAPLLKDPGAVWPDRLLFSHWNGRTSVRSQQYRLDHQGRLYDMTADPGQRYDLASEEGRTTDRLKAAVREWEAEVLPDAPADRPFILGHPDARYTEMPARDGTGHGKIERSNRFPNCSFFENWTETADAITWEAEVSEAGRFAVHLYYTCRRSDVGVELELSLGKSALAATVLEAHDPPLRGMENDRVPRGESYVKAFRSMRMGTIDLPKGRGTLRLRALRIPGERSIDFRGLLFTRLEGK